MGFVSKDRVCGWRSQSGAVCRPASGSGLRTPLANVPCGWVKSASARGGLVRSLFAGLDGKAFEVMEVAGAEAWLEG